eukprot:CAMPEP_0204164414 /NCGR_PEP_ID=MMETSP0361-20130328/37273_1 /ASSEMBLY_ACC=CAM_ASM_000343 /TAXON_ID=268821 /ORGANISM="Scrippsiella Hangoei, Strain SHTV-5" /LENGTH=67 /DNA_ID=CAMNT_0051121285 /DNA_START=68 /DNA_END=268 /DNA_ORIENTATION=-
MPMPIQTCKASSTLLATSWRAPMHKRILATLLESATNDELTAHKRQNGDGQTPLCTQHELARSSATM